MTVPPLGYFIMLKCVFVRLWVFLPPPPSHALLRRILNDFVTKVPPFEDRRDQREVQDLCQRLLEAVAAVAGGSLEQATWFRRALQVKTGEEGSGAAAVLPSDSTTAYSVHSSHDLINGTKGE